MSGVSVPLTASTRSNLLSLKQTSSLLQQTQLRLATGKKVNTAIDNATAYFASTGFLQRAGDFARVKDSLGTAIQTLQSASNAIDAITKVVNQAQGLAIGAQQSTDTTVRASLATQFNGLLTQINNLVADATFNGTNLLTGTGNLVVNFNESAAIELTIASLNTTAAAGGINITAALNNWAGNAQIDLATGDLNVALNTLRSRASTFGNNSTIISTRQAFTDGLINTLQVASDNLVLADTNEEGANLQALQASLQLGVVSLGISGQQQQAILRLF